MDKLLKYFRRQDLRLLYIFNQSHRNRFLDILMSFVTQLASLPAVVALGLILWFYNDEEYNGIARELLIILITTHVFVQLIKFLTRRPRPFRVEQQIVAKHPPTTKCSFPSGHSCAAFSVALTLGFFFHILAVPLLSLALLVGVSRIYLGAHYPSDVLGGLAIALAVFFTCIKI